MKRLLFLTLALLVTSNVWAASTVQYATDGKIDTDRLRTINFRQDGDPTNATDGQLWYNNATHQIKVRDGATVYFWNATGSEEYDDGSVTYLVDEDFEGTGTPSGWANYELYGNYVVSYDATDNPIAGSQSLKLSTPDTGYGDVRVAFTGSSAGNVLYFKINSNYNTIGSTLYFAGFYADGTQLCRLALHSSLHTIGINMGGETNYSSTEYDADTDYYFKLDYTPGTGSNAVGRVSLWNGASWTVLVSMTDGTQTATATHAHFTLHNGGANSVYFDDVQVTE